MTDIVGCADVRKELDFDRLEPQQLLSLEAHIRSCQGCAVWRSQIVALSQATHKLQEFDVPINVTENILSAVAKSNRGESHLWIYAVMGIGACFYLHSADLFDTADSSISWFVSLLILVAFKFLAEKTHVLSQKRSG